MFRKILVLLIGVSTALASVPLSAVNIPRLFNYQAVLFDDGGNPLPDGKTNLLIRLYNTNKEVIYEESQTVDVVSGVVSVAVGAGFMPGKDAPTGGIDIAGLFPDGPRYLEVEAEGQPPQELMELMSVPYSSYAETAFQVATGAVGPAQLAKGALTLNHFTDDLVSQLSAKILGDGAKSGVVAREEFSSYKSVMAGESGGASVGVVPDFTYSSGENVQRVLRDFDLAIKKREEDARMVELSAKRYVDNRETATRQYADTQVTAVREYTNTQLSTIQTSLGNYASKTDLETHINNVSNPHNVTAEQVGATTVPQVTEMIQTQVGPIIAKQSLSPVGRGKIEVTGGFWEIDKSNTDLSCVFIDGSGAKTTGDFTDQRLRTPFSGPVWSVTCITKKESMTCGAFGTCSSVDEIVPQFDSSSKPSARVGGQTLIDLPESSKKWSTPFWKMAEGKQPEECMCLELVRFELGELGGFSEGTSISWTLNKRPL